MIWDYYMNKLSNSGMYTNNNKANTLKPISPTRWTAKIMY